MSSNSIIPLKIYRHICEDVASALDDKHVIFDPDSPEPLDIRAGLDGKHHPRHDRIIGQGPRQLRDPRILMHFEAETVAGPMPKASASS
jgi:hypothetical protein